MVKHKDNKIKINQEISLNLQISNSKLIIDNNYNSVVDMTLDKYIKLNLILLSGEPKEIKIVFFSR